MVDICIKFVLVLLLLCLLCPLCLATEYTIQDSDLIQLEQIFGRLEQNNNELLSKLNNSEITIAQLLTERASYLAERQSILNDLENYKQKFTLSVDQLNRVQSLLTKANESLSTLEKKIKSLETQRNLAVLAAILIAVFKR